MHHPHDITPQKARKHNNHDWQRNFPESAGVRDKLKAQDDVQNVRMIVDRWHGREIHTEVTSEESKRKADDCNERQAAHRLVRHVTGQLCGKREQRQIATRPGAR